MFKLFLDILKSDSGIDIEIHHFSEQLLPERGDSLMVKLESSFFFILFQKGSKLIPRKNILVEQLTSQHFIEYVTCAEDIALCVVNLSIFEVFIMEKHFRSRVKRSTFSKGSFQPSSILLGSSEVSYLQNVVFGN